MATPRPRQLRRDKTLFPFAMNITRLHLEEADRIAMQPHLQETPDADLLLIQQSIDQWVSIATGYVMQKHRCPAPQAMQLLGELLGDLKSNISVNELRQVPFQHALRLPPQLLAGQESVVAEQ
jgi:hypothetical protein